MYYTEASPIPFEAGSQQKDTSSFNVSTERLAQESQKARDALLLGGRRLKDITDEFASASSRLSPGQLIKDEDFTLFEAVGALEVSGECVPARENDDVHATNLS